MVAASSLWTLSFKLSTRTSRCFPPSSRSACPQPNSRRGCHLAVDADAATHRLVSNGAPLDDAEGSLSIYPNAYAFLFLNLFALLFLHAGARNHVTLDELSLSRSILLV